MDSITQAALGAVVSEAVLGRKLGNKAVYWGLWWGTLPDLDVLAFPWLDHAERLHWHRGWSHGLLFMILASPLFGWLMQKIHRGSIPLRSASWAVFWCLSTHVLIDVFTVYGTQVFAPFSEYRAGFNNLFIIDFFFTGPLLLSLVILIFLHRENRYRAMIVWTGLIISTTYVLLSFGAKGIAHAQFTRALNEQKIPHTRLMTAPTPLNIVLWRCVAETTEGYYIGYYSLLDRAKPERFDFVPRNGQLLDASRQSRHVSTLLWFSDGFYTVRQENGHLIFSDLRFGEMRPHPSTQAADSGLHHIPSTEGFEYVFSWNIVHKDGNWIMEQRPHARRAQENTFRDLWNRIKGHSTPSLP